MDCICGVPILLVRSNADCCVVCRPMRCKCSMAQCALHQIQKGLIHVRRLWDRAYTSQVPGPTLIGQDVLRADDASSQLACATVPYSVRGNFTSDTSFGFSLWG